MSLCWTWLLGWRYCHFSSFSVAKKIKIVQFYFTENNEPIIYHGYTLTSKILFKDVMQDAILPYGFFSTDYPLILSIENHCSIEQQDVLADHMKNILGDFLYTDPVDFDK